MKAMYVGTKKVKELYVGPKKVKLAYVGKKLSYAVTTVPEETCAVTVYWSGVSSVVRTIGYTGQIITYTQDDSSVDETTFYAYEGDTLVSQAKEYYTFAAAGSVVHKNSPIRNYSNNVTSGLLSISINPQKCYGIRVTGTNTSTSAGVYAYKPATGNYWRYLTETERWKNPTDYLFTRGSSAMINDKFTEAVSPYTRIIVYTILLNPFIDAAPIETILQLNVSDLGGGYYEN